MATAELHGAFVWDCDECGKENFERAVEGNIDEAALMADENRIHGELVAFGVEGEGEDRAADMLMQRILVAPETVTCKHCGQTHEVHVPSEADD